MMAKSNGAMGCEQQVGITFRVMLWISYSPCYEIAERTSDNSRKQDQLGRLPGPNPRWFSCRFSSGADALVASMQKPLAAPVVGGYDEAEARSPADASVMAWYADLSPCDYLGAAHASLLKAVGWLTPAQLFTTGPVSTEVFRRLCQLTQDPWGPFASAGVHDCEFCRFTGGGEARYDEFRVSARSTAVVFVPGDGFLYVSPANITHYIDAHGYRPPDEFAQAVLGCPAMRSVEYLSRILKNGGRPLVCEAMLDDDRRS